LLQIFIASVQMTVYTTTDHTQHILSSSTTM